MAFSFASLLRRDTDYSTTATPRKSDTNYNAATTLTYIVYAVAIFILIDASQSWLFLLCGILGGYVWLLNFKSKEVLKYSFYEDEPYTMRAIHQCAGLAGFYTVASMLIQPTEWLMIFPAAFVAALAAYKALPVNTAYLNNQLESSKKLQRKHHNAVQGHRSIQYHPGER